MNNLSPNPDELEFLDRVLALLPFQGSAEQLRALGQLWQDASGASSVKISLANSPRSVTLPETVPADGEPRQISFQSPLGDELGRILLTGSPDPVPGEEYLFPLTRKLFLQGEEFQLALRDAKLDALGEFSAGAGHEINNPVATITGRVQLLLAGETDSERRRALETIAGQALRIRDMIGDVMLFARPPAPQPQALVLQDWLPGVVEKFRSQATAAGCSLSLQLPPSLVIWADPVQAAVALGAVLRNSIEASPHGGEIQISAELLLTDESPRIRVSIADHGKGLSDLEREHLFDPFFSGRQAGRGLGFGLSKAWRILTLHGGEISAYPRPEGGLRLDLLWPAPPGEN